MSVSRRDTTSSLIADLRRRVGWLEKRTAPAGAKKLDDLSDVTIRTPGAAQVLTYDGAQWVNAAAVAGDLGVLETVAEYTDDGIFSEIASFEWSQFFTVNANSRQLVIVTALCTGTSNCSWGSFLDSVTESNVDINMPPPWNLSAFDATHDPSATDVVGQNAIGAGYAQCALWLTNDTDEDRSNSVNVTVAAGSTIGIGDGTEFDATVTVTARSVFSLVAP